MGDFVRAQSLFNEKVRDKVRDTVRARLSVKVRDEVRAKLSVKVRDTVRARLSVRVSASVTQTFYTELVVVGELAPFLVSRVSHPLPLRFPRWQAESTLCIPFHHSIYSTVV